MLLNKNAITETISSIYTVEDMNKAMTKRVPNILRVDSYKGEHHDMFNGEADFVNAYVGFRKGEFTCPAGIVNAVTEILDFTVTIPMISIMEAFHKAHGGENSEFNRGGWLNIIVECDGKLPLEVTGAEEGSLVAVKTPIINVRNTRAGYGWLVPYFIDALLRIWKASSISTNVLITKSVLYQAAKASGASHEDIMEWLAYAHHDFGARSAGCASDEAAGAGLGHLPHFRGSDNWEATWLAYMLYGTDDSVDFSELASSSVFAMEHNVVLSHGKDKEHEFLLSTALNLLRKGRIGSILIDTFNIDASMDFLCANLDKFEEAWIEGGMKGKVVFRPDSGHEVNTPLEVAEKLLTTLGITDLSKPRLLPAYLGVIQGDGVNSPMLIKFGYKAKALAISLLNFVFGQGGELLNGAARDDQSWNGKVNAVEINNQVIPVCKSPIGSPGKKSIEGYATVEAGDFLISAVTVDTYEETQLPFRYFLNGQVFAPTLNELRDTANKSFMSYLKHEGIV